MSAAECLFACLGCCADCFNDMAKYISKHAYIESALHNTNFCQGCTESALLITENIWKIGMLHGICNLAIIFGSLTIAGITTLIAFLIMRSIQMFGGAVFETLAPLIVIIF
jgi:Plasma-membrane choline transporter